MTVAHFREAAIVVLGDIKQALADTTSQLFNRTIVAIWDDRGDVHSMLKPFRLNTSIAGSKDTITMATIRPAQPIVCIQYDPIKSASNSARNRPTDGKLKVYHPRRNLVRFPYYESLIKKESKPIYKLFSPKFRPLSQEIHLYETRKRYLIDCLLVRCPLDSTHPLYRQTKK